MSRCYIRLGSGACLLLSLAAFALDETNGFLDMSLDGLLKIEVSVASNTNENITQASAIVSRYNAEDMKALGFHTLKDMLSFIPGLGTNNSEIGTTTLLIRGLVEGFDQKVLFMVDGVPYWQPNHGDNALSGIPIEMVSHVEVIHGPGGVIYGTNTSGGVVNVVTRKDRGGTARLGPGLNGLFTGDAHSGWGLTNGGKLNLSLGLRREDGYDEFYNTRIPPGFYPADTPRAGTLQGFREYNSLTATCDDNKYKVLVQTFDSTSCGLAAAASIVNQLELEYHGWLVHLNRQWPGEK